MNNIECQKHLFRVCSYVMGIETYGFAIENVRLDRLVVFEQEAIQRLRGEMHYGANFIQCCICVFVQSIATCAI